ncbi:uncharacterized protein LOC134243704 [Saccostrea cucullata]|uniref:uncharacterized protein LOC134243704 n=1 Tax=Saccostrea cuccullata TaxID=36930 RepID=UPI002ED4AADE
MASNEGKRAVGRPRILTESARKRAKKERDRVQLRTKVYLGDQYDRWMRKKEELGETHAGLAKMLLDKFLTDSETESADQSTGSATFVMVGKTGKEKFSTPVGEKSKTRFICPPDVSEISSALSENTDVDVPEPKKTPSHSLQSGEESPG